MRNNESYAELDLRTNGGNRFHSLEATTRNAREPCNDSVTARLNQNFEDRILHKEKEVVEGRKECQLLGFYRLNKQVQTLFSNQ